MNPVIDFILVSVFVFISALIAGYTLSPLKAKRWMLSKLSPIIGVRIITKLLPGQCGCDGCPTSNSTAHNPKLK